MDGDEILMMKCMGRCNSFIQVKQAGAIWDSSFSIPARVIRNGTWGKKRNKCKT